MFPDRRLVRDIASIHTIENFCSFLTGIFFLKKFIDVNVIADTVVNDVDVVVDAVVDVVVDAVVVVVDVDAVVVVVDVNLSSSLSTSTTRDVFRRNKNFCIFSKKKIAKIETVQTFHPFFFNIGFFVGIIFLCFDENGLDSVVFTSNWDACQIIWVKHIFTSLDNKIVSIKSQKSNQSC